jgi:heme/copper-type cytochrome/quinol oxidase subunit 2
MFMRIDQKRIDGFFLIVVIFTIIGLPVGIISYDRYLWQEKLPAHDKVFTLTGHTQKGWILGEVQAHDVLSSGLSQPSLKKPVIEISLGDRVVIKLKSSDVVHGFSLKDFGVFITDGIQPGKATLVSFTADKTGVFTFSCNAICGDNHKNMQGSVIVQA